MRESPSGVKQVLGLIQPCRHAYFRGEDFEMKTKVHIMGITRKIFPHLRILNKQVPGRSDTDTRQAEQRGDPEQNPYYRLATVHTTKNVKSTVNNAMNLRYWNGWMCQNLTPDQRIEIASRLDIPPAELEPLDDKEAAKIRARFGEDTGAELKTFLPSATQPIDMSGLGFSSSFSIRNFYCPTRISFDQSEFANGFNCINAVFADKASFNETVFYAKTHFSQASFDASVYFRSAKFNGPCYFKKTRFAGFTRFSEAEFAKNCNFSDATFSARTDFTDAAFRSLVPEFYQATLHQDTRFSEETALWPRADGDFNRAQNDAGQAASNQTKGDKDRKFRLQQNRRAYICLRQISDRNRDLDLTHFFLRQEMRAKEFASDPFERIFYICYRSLSDNGISVWRPTLCLLGLWIMPAVIYASTFRSSILDATSQVSIGTPFGLSFASLFPFLGFNETFFKDPFAQLTPLLTLMSGLQSVLGVIFLFLLGLGLRNKFRMR